MHGNFGQQLLWIAGAMILSAILGAIAKRYGQTRVLGALTAGLVISIVFGSPFVMQTEFMTQLRDGHSTQFIIYLAELAAMALLFKAGLEGNLQSIINDAKTGWKVALIGMVLPIGGGFLYTYYIAAPGADWSIALFQGGVFAATSVGITAAVLGDLGVMDKKYSKIIISAAVIDDVLGLVVLTVCQALNKEGGADINSIAADIGIAAIFIVVVPILGHFFSRPILTWLNRLDPKAREAIVLGWMILYGALAVFAGLAAIVGAYFAGVALEENYFTQKTGTHNDVEHPKEVEHFIDKFIEGIGPVFFVYAGCVVDPAVFMNPSVLTHGMAFTAIAMIGKLLAGLPAKRDRLIIGVGMSPRGEVGLIFATIGYQTKILSPELFGASMIMVLLTTFFTPPILGKLINK